MHNYNRNLLHNEVTFTETLVLLKTAQKAQ